MGKKPINQNYNNMWEIITNSEISDKSIIKRLGYTYLHGKLEEDAGHDVYCLKNCDLPADILTRRIEQSSLKDGMYPCIFNNKPCTLYYWKCNFNDYHGLVVYDDDSESVKYANDCLNNKETVI